MCVGSENELVHTSMWSEVMFGEVAVLERNMAERGVARIGMKPLMKQASQSDRDTCIGAAHEVEEDRLAVGVEQLVRGLVVEESVCVVHRSDVCDHLQALVLVSQYFVEVRHSVVGLVGLRLVALHRLGDPEGRRLEEGIRVAVEDKGRELRVAVVGEVDHTLRTTVVEVRLVVARRYVQEQKPATEH
jgi:hypothetical protein